MKEVQITVCTINLLDPEMHWVSSESSQWCLSDRSWIYGVRKPSISYLYLGYRRTLYLSFILGVSENPLIYIFQYQVYIPLRNGNELLHGRNYTVILNENILL